MRAGRRASARGYGYVLLLVAVAIIAAVAAASLTAGASMLRGAAEDSLLVVGQEFRVAFARYRQATPQGTCPAHLLDLVKDPRFPATRRYLRRIPIDPLSNQAAWEVRRDAAGRITGVHSRAEGRPLKRSQFPSGLESFESAERYSDWVFTCAQ